jgi:hypothetical protein
MEMALGNCTTPGRYSSEPWVGRDLKARRAPEGRRRNPLGLDGAEAPSLPGAPHEIGSFTPGFACGFTLGYYPPALRA